MKKLTLIISVLMALLILVGGPMTALAQDDEETEAELALASDFGEDLVPREAEAQEDEEDESRASSSSDGETTDPDNAAPAVNESDTPPSRAAAAPDRSDS